MTAVLVHEVPRRLRFRVQYLKHDSRRAEWLRDRIAAVLGVVGVSANPLTGSLIITHDGRTATRERITTALEACGHSILTNAPAPPPALVHLGNAPAGAHPLLRIVAETLLEWLLHTALAAVV